MVTMRPCVASGQCPHDAAILGCCSPIGRKPGDRRHWGHSRELWLVRSLVTTCHWSRLSQPWHPQWHPARDGPRSLLSEYLSGQLFTQAPSAESDHHSFVVTPSPRNRRWRGHIITSWRLGPDQNWGQLLSSFLLLSWRVTADSHCVSLFVSSSRYHPPPCPGSS